MKIMTKIRVAVSIVAAAGLFGVCSVLYDNAALPRWMRIVVLALAVVNLICTIESMQELVKRKKK